MEMQIDSFEVGDIKYHLDRPQDFSTVKIFNCRCISWVRVVGFTKEGTRFNFSKPVYYSDLIKDSASEKNNNDYNYESTLVDNLGYGDVIKQVRDCVDEEIGSTVLIEAHDLDYVKDCFRREMRGAFKYVKEGQDTLPPFVWKFERIA